MTTGIILLVVAALLVVACVIGVAVRIGRIFRSLTWIALILAALCFVFAMISFVNTGSANAGLSTPPPGAAPKSSAPPSATPTVTPSAKPAVKVALEDPGPGRCVAAPAILKQLRQEKPGGEDYKAPYSTTELQRLSSDWIAWISANPTKPCVKALAASVNVPVDKFPKWISKNWTLKELSAPLPLQNSYFDHTDGHIVWWETQIVPAGELMWFDHSGNAVDKYICGNRQRSQHGTPSVATPQTSSVPPTPLPSVSPSCVPTPGVESCGKHQSFAQPITGPTPAKCQGVGIDPATGNCRTTTYVPPKATPAPGQAPGQGDSGRGATNTVAPSASPTTTAPKAAIPTTTSPSTAVAQPE
jgi:hypothetical protein